MSETRDRLARHLFHEQNQHHRHPDDPPGDPWDRCQFQHLWRQKADALMPIVADVWDEGYWHGIDAWENLTPSASRLDNPYRITNKESEPTHDRATD
jgi:hypothetical protein